MLSDSCIGAGWEAERENIHAILLSKGFNRNAIDRAATNYIESMVFANIPCTTEAGVKAAAVEYQRERHYAPVQEPNHAN